MTIVVTVGVTQCNGMYLSSTSLYQLMIFMLIRQLLTYITYRPGPIPLGYCQTNARNESESDYSEMFLCTSWGQIYHFSWNDTTCTGEPSDTLEVTSNSGYECYSADTCEIFNVRSNTLGSDGTCAEDTEVYDEIVVVANECFVEADENGWRSIKAVCTSETSVSYQIYPDVIGMLGIYRFILCDFANYKALVFVMISVVSLCNFDNV